MAAHSYRPVKLSTIYHRERDVLFSVFFFCIANTVPGGASRAWELQVFEISALH
jgi:hypothetical protein